MIPQIPTKQPKLQTSYLIVLRLRVCRTIAMGRGLFLTALSPLLKQHSTTEE